jgi:hypothetical protein
LIIRSLIDPRPQHGLRGRTSAPPRKSRGDVCSTSSKEPANNNIERDQNMERGPVGAGVPGPYTKSSELESQFELDVALGAGRRTGDLSKIAVAAQRLGVLQVVPGSIVHGRI